jgi:eukaryotic-like serine/threonine-protein kinase
MTSDLFSRAEPILAEALSLEGDARTARLDHACGRDPALRREVESLLAFEVAAAAFLERPALEDVAREMASELDPAGLVGRQLGDYRVDGVLGVGGMADVYRVRNLPLARDEALKVLASSPLVPDADRARVESEARAASRLNHPNIVTIFAVGEADGLHFIAMELVEGDTLRQRLAAGPLPTPVVADFAVQLSEALASAHAAGIVHRDLKPENIKITPGGRLKVLDFGIAGWTHADTAGGAVAGTAGYMAPEQAEGQPARPASDQFSFGVILHELLAGRAPFVAKDHSAMLAAARTATPATIAGLDAFGDALMRRCLAKAPEDRFASTDELARACREWRTRVLSEGMTRRRLLQAAALAMTAAATGVATWSLGPWSAPSRRLAVLPFRNVSGDADADYLAAGLTATLIERLGVMPSLTVLPRSLVANFAGSSDAPSDIGRQVTADVVISGEVTRSTNRLVVAAQLLDVGSGQTLWSARYEQPPGGLLLVEEQIAQAIVDEGVRLRLNAEERRRLVRRDTADPEVFDLYLRAVYLCEQETEAAYLEAREILTRALERDRDFGPAHVQMAATYAVMAVDGLERPTDAWPQSSRHVRLALQATPDAADAHASAASHEFFFNWNWEAAEAEWRQAMRFGGADLHPDLYASRALQRAALGRLDEAVALARRARAVDPVSPMFAVREADFLTLMGDASRATAIYEAVLADAPGDVRALFGLSDALRALGRLDEAVAHRRRAHLVLGEHEVMADERLTDDAAELRRLDVASARAQLAALADRAAAGGYVSPIDVARQHARLGETEQAVALFDQAVADRAPGLVMLDVDRAWDTMRGDPRFKALSSRVGLPYPPFGERR